MTTFNENEFGHIMAVSKIIKIGWELVFYTTVFLTHSGNRSTEVLDI